MAITASIRGQSHRQVMAVGFDAYHAKPLDVKTFMATVGEGLTR